MERKKILKRIIEEQNNIIENLENSVARYKIASNLEENSASDPEELSHQAEAKDMQLRYENMLRIEEQNLAFVETEMEENHTEIENGALISTEKNYLFVGISVPVFEFEGKKVVSFSDDAPIFKIVEDKKIGDTIMMGDQKLEIKSIN
ncbi:hypothetical protein [Frigoriflavimonas asaccharolytica]|uniref:Transcription elongation factor n=1 Tax=Frigoriflavimonas asaccharolytica TaxID=2735899 RepID=A0A8J8G9Z0_9FLAO|nr:hypothetical protein [Frigoriflavimonas asaccharolytica]NRS93350.1 hypothetical protein [Frigoriflavimonas asaccharolytica]